MKRTLVSLALLCAPFLGLTPYANAEMLADSCTIDLPKVTPSFTPQWIGLCSKGFAEGLGTATINTKGATFNGTVNHGQAVLGVYDLQDGYEVTKPSTTKTPEDISNHMLHAFREAAKAATATAKHYEKAGDTTNAERFTKLASKLDQQMGD